MKNITRIILITGITLFTQSTVAQVGIGTTSPNSSAVLDVVSTNRGILFPRVALTDTSLSTPLAAHVAGMAVYNIAAPVNDVSPGLYYNDGSKWIRLNNNDWTVNGNAETDVANNFLGTTNNEALAIRTNNIERARFLTNGNVGIDETVPQQKLHIGGTNPTTETIRIEALNNSHPDNNGIDLSPLAVDGDGNLVIGGAQFLSEIEVDEDETTFISPSVYVRTTTGDLVGGTLDSRTITLTQETLVEVNYNISCGLDDGTNANPALSGPLTDGMNRTYGCAVFIDENNDGGAILEGANAHAYSNSDSPWTGGTTTFNSGFFTLTGSVYKILPAGTHQISVMGYVIGPEHTSALNNGTVGAEFGEGYSRIMVIKHN